LRGAGLPVEHVLDLAAPGATRAAERVAEARSRVRNVRESALDAIGASLDRLASEERETRGKLLGAARRLRGRKRQGPIGDRDVDLRLESVGDALDRLRSVEQDFVEAFDEDRRRVSERLRRLVGLPRFRAALLWQNRHTLHHTVLPVLEAPAGPATWKHRRREGVAALYLQRYCTKNDTIGFFGPVGWARFVAGAVPLRIETADEPIDSRSVYFEEWCVNAVARALNADESLLPWLAPRPAPQQHLSGGSLSMPFGRRAGLSAAEARVLAACDGRRTARELAASLCGDAGSGLRDEAEVFELLHRLRGAKRLVWALDAPLELRAERTIRRMLERVDDDALRERAVAPLDRLERAREDVCAAGEDVDRLDPALAGLERTFCELTGEPAQRRRGEFYAGRTLVYEDCRRSGTVELGPAVLDRLSGPLGLLLTSARWLTAGIAAHFVRRFEESYEELAGRAGRAEVDLASFWLLNAEHLFNERPDFVAPVVAELGRKWARILDLPPGERRVERRAAALRDAVREAFRCERPGWRFGCQHSPDVMIAATDDEAVRRGDYRSVLGELHLGLNNLSTACFVSQHPSPGDLVAAQAWDLGEPRVRIAVPRTWRTPQRVAYGLEAPGDFRIVVSDDAFERDERVLNVGELVVVRTERGLVARTRDGRLELDILDVLGHGISVTANSAFRLLPPLEHAPRVSIDELVVCREAWRFPAAGVGFAFKKPEADRFLEARGFVAEHGLPRFAFFRTPLEPKPLYVDFESPLYVDILAKAVRRAAESGHEGREVSIVEMLPRPDEAWLPDAEGRRYVSELRIVAVDLAGREASHPARTARVAQR
jgi:hypothetical protein